MRWPKCWTLLRGWTLKVDWVTTTTAVCSLRMGCKMIGWQLWPTLSLGYPRQLHGHFWRPRLLKSCMVPRFIALSEGGRKEPRQLRTAPRYVCVRRYFQHATPPIPTESPDSSLTKSGWDHLLSLCSVSTYPHWKSHLFTIFTSSRVSCKVWTLMRPWTIRLARRKWHFHVFMENSSSRVGISGDVVALAAPCRPRAIQLDP
jgi:hypothetical protein